MNGPSKVCALLTTKSKMYSDPFVVECGLWPLRCPQRNLHFYYLGAHGKIHNPSCLLCGRKAMASEDWGYIAGWLGLYCQLIGVIFLVDWGYIPGWLGLYGKIMPSTMATTFMPAATACARTPLGPILFLRLTPVSGLSDTASTWSSVGWEPWPGEEWGIFLWNY